MFFKLFAKLQIILTEKQNCHKLNFYKAADIKRLWSIHDQSFDPKTPPKFRFKSYALKIDYPIFKSLQTIVNETKRLIISEIKPKWVNQQIVIGFTHFEIKLFM